MKIKKVFAMFALCAALGATVMPTMASAHHGGSHGRHHSGRYCSLNSCSRTGTHRHHGTTYYGHY